MLKIAAGALAALTATSSVARAAPEGTEAERSDSGATTLSIAGTALGVTALLSGVDSESTPELAVGMVAATLGPAAGHFYANDFFTPGTLVRAAGLATMTYELQHFTLQGDNRLFLAGALTFVGGTVYDIATAGGAAREYNRWHPQLAPAPVKDNAGRISPGFAFAGEF